MQIQIISDSFDSVLFWSIEHHHTLPVLASADLEAAVSWRPLPFGRPLLLHTAKSYITYCTIQDTSARKRAAVAPARPLKRCRPSGFSSLFPSRRQLWRMPAPWQQPTRSRSRVAQSQTLPRGQRRCVFNTTNYFTDTDS